MSPRRHQGAPGSTQEAPRSSQEAPRSTQETPRRQPRDTQGTPRGTKGSRNHFKWKSAKTTRALLQKRARPTISRRRGRRDPYRSRSLRTKMNRHSSGRSDTPSKAPLPTPPGPLQINPFGELYKFQMSTVNFHIAELCFQASKLKLWNSNVKLQRPRSEFQFSNFDFKLQLSNFKMHVTNSLIFVTWRVKIQPYQTLPGKVEIQPYQTLDQLARQGQQGQIPTGQPGRVSRVKF
jgi:hypothetical protein